MAEKANGDYYYDAGTINEQLDDYEVYELDGRLYLNKEGADPEEAISFDGVSEILGAPRTTQPDATELEEGEGALYVYDDEAGAYSLEFAFYVPSGSVVINVLDSALGTA